ncbi:hypothetical protein OKW49_001911 [Paraburkholderia youngii]
MTNLLTWGLSGGAANSHSPALMMPRTGVGLYHSVVARVDLLVLSCMTTARQIQ